ncbi:MAG TPA: SBBP repeat-containing protein, partial [Pseudonocardiaceae bacterium]|nr:SBBP repeat-containing protein [Pseudonocardiaceae bacterium]
VALVVGVVVVVAILLAVGSVSRSSRQLVLPFTGLHYPSGVAVDSAGNVYVTDRGNNRVLKLPAG